MQKTSANGRRTWMTALLEQEKLGTEHGHFFKARVILKATQASPSPDGLINELCYRSSCRQTLSLQMRVKRGRCPFDLQQLRADWL
jgi:hypothetical protein